MSPPLHHSLLQNFLLSSSASPYLISMSQSIRNSSRCSLWPHIHPLRHPESHLQEECRWLSGPLRQTFCGPGVCFTHGWPHPQCCGGAPLGPSLMDEGRGMVKVAQLPHSTGDNSDRVFCTVPGGIGSSYPQSNTTFINYFPCPVSQPRSLTVFPATISKTNSLHPHLSLRLCFRENTCFVCCMLLPASGTALLVCSFKSSHCQRPPSFPLRFLARGVCHS